MTVMAKHTPRIFVAIPSYRDRECQWTLKDLFEQARHPERVFAGVCWQTVPAEDADCFGVDLPRPDQIRVVHYHCNDAKGLGWARREAQKLWRGEEYHLQIDSHMRFVPDWDEKMLAMLENCDSEWPVLTVYPPCYTPPRHLQPISRPYIQCVDRFSSSGIVEFTARQLPPGIEVNRPLPTACCAGGFQFGSCRTIRDCPADPDIYFSGEEPSQAARLWTHGFDLYSPNETVIYHYYQRDDSRHHWEDHRNWSKRHEETLRRLLRLLQPNNRMLRTGSVDPGPFGLGNRRRLVDYEHFSGINFSGKTIAAFARNYPFIHTSDIGLAEPHNDIQLSADAHLFIIDNEGLLFTGARNEILHLNTTATYIWCLMEDGLRGEQLASALADARDISLPESKTELARLFTHWSGQGLLAGTEDLPHRRKPENITGSLNRILQPEPQRNHSHDRVYHLLGSRLTVRYTDTRQETGVHPLIAHLEVAAGPHPRQTDTNPSLLLLSTDSEHFICSSSGEVLDQAGTLEGLAPMVCQRLLQQAIGQYDHILHIPATVVAKGSSCIALTGSTDSGSRTQTAVLLAAGFDYLSGDAALLERGTCLIPPCPLCLCIDADKVDALTTRYPQLQQLPGHLRSDGHQVRYLPPPPERIARQAHKLTHIVFRRYQAGADAQLQALTAMQGMERILQECVAIPQPLLLQDAALLVDWIEHIQCYELVCGKPEDTPALLGKLLDCK